MKREKFILENERRTSFRIIMSCILASSFIFSCKKGDVEKDKQDDSKITIHSKGSDPRWFSYNYSDESIFTFYGTKTSDGMPESLNLIRRARTDPSELASSYFIDNNQRIESIITDDGLRIDASYLQDGKINLRFLTGDGEEQLNTSSDAIEDLAARMALPVNLTPRNGQNIVINQKEETDRLRVADPKLVNSQGVFVNVYNCGIIPTNVDKVFVRMHTKQHKLIGVFPAHHWGMTGLYMAVLPSNVADDFILTAGDLCRFGLSLSYGGVFAKGGKIALVAALREGLKRAASQKVKEQIEKAIDDLLTLNDILKNLEAIEKAFCKAKLDEYSENFGGVFLTAEAHSPGNGNNLFEISRGIVYGEKTEASGEGRYPDLSVNLGNNARIVGPIILNPERPAVNQGYTATANFGCLTLNSQVTISVSGTDGYSDKVTFIASLDSPPNQYSIWVPGADTQGIQDIITVSAVSHTGEPIDSITASLIFGN